MAIACVAGFDLPPLMFSRQEAPGPGGGAASGRVAPSTRPWPRRPRTRCPRVLAVLPIDARGRLRAPRSMRPRWRWTPTPATTSPCCARPPSRATSCACNTSTWRICAASALGGLLVCLFWGRSGTVAAWCELREDCSFRVDPHREPQQPRPLPRRAGKTLAGHESRDGLASSVRKGYWQQRKRTRSSHHRFLVKALYARRPGGWRSCSSAAAGCRHGWQGGGGGVVARSTAWRAGRRSKVACAGPSALASMRAASVGGPRVRPGRRPSAGSTPAPRRCSMRWMDDHIDRASSATSTRACRPAGDAFARAASVAAGSSAGSGSARPRSGCPCGHRSPCRCARPCAWPACGRWNRPRPVPTKAPRGAGVGLAGRA